MSISRNTFNLGKVPFLVTERTDTTSLEPTLDAVQVKDVATIAKRNAQTIVIGRRRIGLILDTGLVERVSTNGAL